jgi:hypothetical protein
LYIRIDHIGNNRPHDLNIEDYFDSEALERNILLPKKEYLNRVYDNMLDTDRWLID